MISREGLSILTVPDLGGASTHTVLYGKYVKHEGSVLSCVATLRCDQLVPALSVVRSCIQHQHAGQPASQPRRPISLPPIPLSTPAIFW